MKLQDLNPASLLYLERYVNNKSYSQFSNFSAVSEQYRPESSTVDFKVPYYLLDPNRTRVTFATPLAQKQHRSFVKKNNKVLFYIHPDILTADGHTQWNDPFLQELLATEPDGYVTAIPTSSTRTIFIPDHQLYLKLHIPKRISRFERLVIEPYIQHNIEIVEEIAGSTNNEYAFLPDIIGVSERTSNWGYMVRDALVHPTNGERNIIIPAFSLYGTDANRTNDLPLVIQMLKTSRQSPVELVTEMVAQVLTAWWQIYLTTGAIHDIHGQNILFEIENGKITRPIFRDYYALTLDNERRRKVGIPITKSPMNEDNPIAVKRIFSNIYDYQFGHHFMNFLLDSLKANLKDLNEETIKRAVKKIARKVIDTNKFPETMYKYKNKTFTDGSEELTDTKELPTWR